MNYFSQIPEELLYTILIYVDYEDILKLSKTFKLYVDFDTVLFFKFPKTYKNLKSYIDDGVFINTELLFQLEWIKYNDDPEEILQGFKDRAYPVEDLYDLVDMLSANVLEKNYPELIKYFIDFPDYNPKYFLIYHDIKLLEKYKETKLYKLIFENYDPNKLTKEDIDTINGDFQGQIFIYVYLLVLRYNIADKFKFYIEFNAEFDYNVNQLVTFITDPYSVYRCILVSELYKKLGV